jgi:hypothetical protein
LITFPAGGGAATRQLRFQDDLRDVLVQGDELLVTRFRSAEMLRISANNQVVMVSKPGPLTIPDARPCSAGQPAAEARRFEPNTAWPSLVGVSFRSPFMHDGCAPTLKARFEDCGKRHGRTAHLTDQERTDLVQYMKSL